MKNEEWRVGILFSRSGVTAAVETTMANATLLAIEEINSGGGVLGRQITPIYHDPECSPRKYREMAARLLASEGVRSIFGCYMSSCRKAVLPEIDTWRGLLFYPTFYEGFEYSPRCFYTGAASNQGAVPFASYLMNKYGAKFLLVGSNYVFPYEYNRVITDLVTQAHGKILDEIYVPIEAKAEDFKRVIKQIARLSPDVVFSTVVGDGMKLLYDAYSDAGFDAAQMPIASVTLSEAEIALLHPRVATGHLTSAPFFETLKTPEARSFVKAYKARFGNDAPVTGCAEAAYFQVHLYAKALELAGTDAPDEIARTLLGLEIDAPQGRIRIDPDNHHTEIWPRIGRINEQGQFDIVWESRARVKPDPYFVAPSFDVWSNDVGVFRE